MDERTPKFGHKLNHLNSVFEQGVSLTDGYETIFLASPQVKAIDTEIAKPKNFWQLRL